MYFQDKDKLSSNLDVLKNITAYWDEINKSIITVTQNLGQTNDSLNVTGSYSYAIGKNFQNAAVQLEKMGVGTKEVSQFLSNMSDYTGTMVGFASEAMEKYGALQKILGASNIDATLENYNSLGKGLTTSTKLIEDMTMASYKMGLNASKVAKTMNANFKSASNISFKGGSKEIAEMARESVKLGVDMGQVISKSRELRNPEQAIEFSQNMQMLGGDFANLFGDASNVLYNARNNTKQFQKDISKASASLVSVNSITGELEVLPENFDKASLAAAQLGMDVDTFLESGKKAKKLEIFKDTFKGLTEDQANVLTGFANIKEGGQISLEGLDKDTIAKAGLNQSELSDITKLSSDKMENLVKVLQESGAGGEKGAKTIEDQVMATRTLTDAIGDLKNVIQASSTASNKLSKDLNATDGLRGTVQNAGLEENFKNLSMVTVGFANVIVDEVTPAIKNLAEIINKDLEDVSTGKKKQEPEKGGKKEESPKPKTQEPEKIKRGTIVKTTKSMGTGGIFNGPSHKEGGIPVLNKTNGKMLEVEGGEAIINKNSTEMFKPLLSKINESGGGVKFDEGGITPVDIENIMSKMGSMTNTSNVNVGSSSPVNVNVNINGSISIDGKDFTIPDNEKEKLSKTLIKEVMIKVNSEIGQSTIFTGGRKKATDNTFDY